MTGQDFAEAVEALILEAKALGLDDDVIVAELTGIIAGMTDDP